MTYDEPLTSGSSYPDPHRPSSTSYSAGYYSMAGDGAVAPSRRPRPSPVPLIISYVLDWLVLIAMVVVATLLGNITPNKRPFFLTNPNIS